MDRPPRVGPVSVGHWRAVPLGSFRPAGEPSISFLSERDCTCIFPDYRGGRVPAECHWQSAGVRDGPFRRAGSGDRTRTVDGPLSAPRIASGTRLFYSTHPPPG